VFINPPWELADHIGQHFESCRQTTPTSTMAVLYYRNGQSSTSSLNTRNSTKYSLLGHMFYSSITGEPSSTRSGCSTSMAYTVVVTRRRLCFLRSGFAYKISDQPTSVLVPPVDTGNVHRYATTISSASYSPTD
jgi:hypothetical protein